MIRFGYQSLLVLLLLIIHHVQFCHCVHDLRSWLEKRAGGKLSFLAQDGLKSKLLFRGGDNDNDNELPEANAKSAVIPDHAATSAKKTATSEITQPIKSIINKIKYRRTYDMILDLRRRSSVQGNDESLALRNMITTRANDYITDIREALELNESKITHPRKLLHYLAPKVPAIKQSPDVNLRIHSARSDMDSGVAACIIGTLAHVCEIFDKETMKQSPGKISSSASEVTTDRRFEQLVECVVSGVNVLKRKKQSLTRQLEKNSEEAADIEHILDQENAKEDEGLNVRDACRAAWGISILGCSHLDELGDVNVLDLLLALSLRVRELLLARLQLLRQEDLFSDPSASHLTTEERIDDLAEELAEDAATAMWTFACAKACTGMRSIPLFEACSSILCQNPVEMRERAQAADYEPGVPLGTNDVIDRLARSEIEDESVTEEERKVKDENFVEEGNTEKDALLDWLSPTEINDVLWAIALHGSVNGTSTLDEAPLSETVVALREIAFDRMIDWLEHDLIISSPLEFESNRVTEISTQSIMNGESAVTVEVVDAATLLASEMQSSEVKAQTIPVENITLEADVGVKVVDAAALLASIGDENAEPIESEVIQTPVLLDHDTKVQNEDHGPTERMGSNDQNLVIAPNDRRLDPIFSLHDLATMAWSVTELRDSLKVKIVGIVIELIERMGQHDLACLTGGDLANLAWAVSKYEDQLSEIEPNRPNSLSISVTSWIARTSLQKVLKSLQSGDSSPRSLNVLESFQPPELGRLVWSVASTMSTYSEVPRQVKLNSEIMELARLSLEAAASNLSLFATEDLLRISWAFLELCGDESHMMTLSAADALGSILATVEQSLHRWERGECNRAMPSPNQNNDASVFSSFFGKSRLNQQLLEHMLIDGEDEDDSVLAPLLEESRKPLLKDLSLDPSTLCKAACSLQRLSRAYPNMKGGWTITRVAVRLLSSKNAQLMKECSIHDISRLCEATVLSEADGHGRELITGLFARKVIQVLNDSLDSTAEKQDGCIEVSAASSRELCLLLWSLGELGAKHYRNDDARHLAYKKMRLVSEAPLLSKDQIESLDFSSSLKLFRGLVLMNFMSSDKSFLLLVLQKVEMETKNMRSSIDLCSLAESIAVLKEALKPGTTGDESGNIVKKVSISENAVHEQIELTGDESSGQVKENEESLTLEENMPPLDDATIDEEMRQLCDIILTFIGSQARDMAGKLSSVEIRRFLVVYSLLPFQDDELVNDFAQEIENRLLHLQRSPNSSFESLLINARSKTLSVNTTLFGDSSSGSRFDLIKNGIKNLFSSSDDVDTLEKKEENLITEELESLIQESASTTSMAAKSIENLHIASGISLDSIFQDLKRGTAFELGRCNELIENYRRIEFSTGKFRSRYDKERRQDIAKRVLSRLLP